MNLISSEKKEKNETQLKIEITPEELETAINKTYLKNRKRIGVPGFRKGKAPRKIIEKMYGQAIFMSDALEGLLPEVLEFVDKNSGLNIAGFPTITDIDVKDSTESAFITLTVTQKPEVTVGKYKGLSAPKPSAEISDSEIMREIDAVRERNARMESVSRPAASGDIAVIDFEGFIDGTPFEGGKGERYSLELGSGSFIPGFEEKVEGMEIGERRDIDLVFPENYQKDLAGKAVVFKVALSDVREKHLPELDDEFAKDVSEFDTLDEYKQSIREKLEKTKQTDIDETFEKLLMEQIVKSTQAEIPQVMIEEEIEKTAKTLSRNISAYGMKTDDYLKMLGITADEFKERMREPSEFKVKSDLALEKIAELEGLKVSDDEIEEEYIKAAKAYNVELDKFKEEVDNDAVVRELKMRAALKLVTDSATVEQADEKSPADKAKPASKKSPAKQGKTANKDTAAKPAKEKKEEETKK
ncbi:MAG: trigger factor [Oscillospiraceae bacterium]|nr:trigger factor [Oscillospiraceae bacterium]